MHHVKCPRIVLQTDVTNRMRAEIMGAEKPSKHSDSVAKRIRIVQTDADPWPKFIVEEPGGVDAMGNVRWQTCELPSEILIALLLRGTRGQEYLHLQWTLTDDVAQPENVP